MVRLGTSFACAALLAAGISTSVPQANAQARPSQLPPGLMGNGATAAPMSPAGAQVQPTQSPQFSTMGNGAAAMPVPRPNAQAIPTQPQQPSTTSSGVTAAQVQRSAKGRSRAQRAALQEQPQVPAPPPTLEQSPPSAPNVRMQNGLLMIDAHNSTLSQVLRAVQQQTGASMEVPAGASNERVVAQIGPGQPRDVINTLLNGSKFDYVILGVLGNPGAVQKVILTPRQGGSTGSMNAQANTPPPPQPADDVQDESVPVADNGDA